MPHEVTEETRETIHVLELDRTPRPQKLAAERAYFDGAHEVRFTERTFRPKQGSNLDDIRAFVDSLEVRRREVPPLPTPPVVAPVQVPQKIPDHYRTPLEAAIRGALISVDTVHRVGAGTVVDVAWESEDEGERRGLYIIEDDVATPYDSVASSVDSLPAPRVNAPPAQEAAPPQEAPPAQSEKQEKKGLLGKFGKKTTKPEPAPAPTAVREPAAPQEEPKKRRFGFGRGK